jgi:2-methylcitrate dehydratase PrpD
VRAKVSAEVDPSIKGEDSARIAITLKDGRTVETFVEHATGSPENPMSDETLEAKYSALADEVLGEKQANELLSAVWALDQAGDVTRVTRLMVKS